MPHFLNHVQPKLHFIPQTINPCLIRLIHRGLPLLMRIRTQPWLPAGIARVDSRNEEIMAQLYQQFQSGTIRLVIAFRHVEVDDPLCGLYLLSRSVPRAAQHLGICLEQPLHSHFIYERGMPLWAGAWLGWLFSQIGGVPVRRGREPDWKGLRVVRDLLLQGQLPLAVAPEGGTNGHSGIVSPLEPGVAQMGFWAVNDLHHANRTESVVIVPVGIQYHYLDPPWEGLSQLLDQLEAESGLSTAEMKFSTNVDRSTQCYQRLLRLGDHLLTRMETFYRRFYHEPISRNETDPQSHLSQEQILAERLHHLMDVSLRVAEMYFNIPAKGNPIERCRRLEEAGWTYIYRDDIEDVKSLSQLDRGLADWVAAEANLRLLHMRLVESFVAVSGTYIQDKPTIERLCEMALLLYDVLARLRGDKLPARPRLGWRKATVTVADPISVTDRWPEYRSDRRAAIKHLTDDIKVALEKTII